MLRGMNETRHLGVAIGAPADELYDWIRDPRHLVRWAAGLATAEVRQEGGHWIADSPMGRVGVAFAAVNPWGIVDHDVTLPSGEVVSNPMRVIPRDGGADVVFTVRRRDDMTAAQFDADCDAVSADLSTLKALFEGS